jgi:hypothetical protein
MTHELEDHGPGDDDDDALDDDDCEDAGDDHGLPLLDGDDCYD